MLYSPLVADGIQVGGTVVPDALVTLWSEKSAIRQELYDTICQSDLCQTFVQKSHRLLSAWSPQTPIVAFGICTLSMRIGRKEFRHYMSVVPKLSHSVYVGADILVRLGAQVVLGTTPKKPYFQTKEIPQSTSVMT